MGVLVASAIGLIVIIGLTKLFVHMNSQISQLEQQAKRSNLISLLGHYINEPQHCKETLMQAKTQISNGNNTNLYIIKVKDGGSVIDLPTEQNQLKSKYGMEGLVKFQLKCEETGGTTACQKCAGSFPCPPIQWSLSLISQSFVSGVPKFNSILKIPLVITHTGPNNNDFECGRTSPGIDLSNANCPSGQVLTGFNTHGNKICVRKGPSNVNCPSGQVLTGFDSNGNKICVTSSVSASDILSKFNFVRTHVPFLSGTVGWSTSARTRNCPTGGMILSCWGYSMGGRVCGVTPYRSKCIINQCSTTPLHLFYICLVPKP